MNKGYIPGNAIYNINDLYNLSNIISRQGYPLKYKNNNTSKINGSTLHKLFENSDTKIKNEIKPLDDIYKHKKYTYSDILFLLNINAKPLINGHLLLTPNSIYNPEKTDYNKLCKTIKHDLNDEELLLLKNCLDSFLHIYSKKQLCEHFNTKTTDTKNILKYLFFLQKIIQSPIYISKVRVLL